MEKINIELTGIANDIKNFVRYYKQFKKKKKNLTNENLTFDLIFFFQLTIYTFYKINYNV